MSDETRFAIYSTVQCPYCIAAKRLLTERKIAYQEIDLTDDFDQINEVKQKYGHFTVPIILFDGALVGGYTELAEWDQSGELKHKFQSTQA